MYSFTEKVIDFNKTQDKIKVSFFQTRLTVGRMRKRNSDGSLFMEMFSVHHEKECCSLYFWDLALKFYA